MDKTLQQLVQGRLASSRLPRSIYIWDLEADLADLRRRSLEVAAHLQVEWGGCIISKGDGLGLTHLVSGRKDGVDPECQPQDLDHGSYVGFAHTHLPSDLTEKPYLGFSERDFRGTLADGDNLALVCNGPEVFALVRTADRTQPPQRPDASEFESWEKLYDDLIGQARNEMDTDPKAREAGSQTLNRYLWKANRELCRRLGFAFYRGRWGQPLVRVFRP
jgi:hypothetical protein